MSAPRFTAATLAATPAGRRASNAARLGVAADVLKPARSVKAVKIVTLPPSTYDAAAGVCAVVIPLPPKDLHPNARCHFRAKLKPRQDAREAATYAAGF